MLKIEEKLVKVLQPVNARQIGMLQGVPEQRGRGAVCTSGRRM